MTSSSGNSESRYQPIVDAYAELKDLYNQDDDGINEWLFRDLILRMVSPSMNKALDVGCGAGRMALAVAQKVPYVMGIDITPAMIATATENAVNTPSAHFAVGDVQTFEFTDKFDYIFAIYSLGYVDRATTLRKLKALLNPGGKLLVIDGITDPSAQFNIRDMLAYLLQYFAFRLRHGLGLNFRSILRNMNRVSALAAHPAWHVVEEWHSTHAITWPQYKALIAAELPGAKTELVGKQIGFCFYTANA